MNWPDEIQVISVDSHTLTDSHLFEEFLAETREHLAQSHGGVLLNCESVESASPNVLRALHEVQSEALTMRKRFALFRVSAPLFESISQMDEEYPLQCYSLAKRTPPKREKPQQRPAPMADPQSGDGINLVTVAIVSLVGLVATCLVYGIYLYLSF